MQHPVACPQPAQKRCDMIARRPCTDRPKHDATIRRPGIVTRAPLQQDRALACRVRQTDESFLTLKSDYTLSSWSQALPSPVREYVTCAVAAAASNSLRHAHCITLMAPIVDRRGNDGIISRFGGLLPYVSLVESCVFRLCQDPGETQITQPRQPSHPRPTAKETVHSSPSPT